MKEYYICLEIIGHIINQNINRINRKGQATIVLDTQCCQSAGTMSTTLLMASTLDHQMDRPKQRFAHSMAVIERPHSNMVPTSD